MARPYKKKLPAKPSKTTGQRVGRYHVPYCKGWVWQQVSRPVRAGGKTDLSASDFAKWAEARYAWSISAAVMTCGNKEMTIYVLERVPGAEGSTKQDSL